MPGLISSHGTSVSFNGTPIGYLRDFEWEGKAGELYDATNINSVVVGVGPNARVVKRYDVTAVEPLTLTIAFWGPPSYSQNDAGLKSTLVFNTVGTAQDFTAEAILMTFSHKGQGGQWSTGAATFQLTGKPNA